MKLFIDECLSPSLAARLNASGEHDAMHPRDYGRLGERDDQVLAHCLEESRTIVTENAVDFRKLAAATEIHPGSIILPCVSRSESERLLDLVLTEIAIRGEPSSVMINRVVEITAAGEFASTICRGPDARPSRARCGPWIHAAFRTFRARLNVRMSARRLGARPTEAV